MPSTTFRTSFRQLLYWPMQIQPISLWLKLTLLISGWGRFSPNELMTVNSNHVPFSPANCLRLNAIMTWGIDNCWPLNWP